MARKTSPSPAQLSLSSKNAAEDLERLGWIDNDVLYTLGAAGSPDLTLNTAYRLAEALGDSYEELRQSLIDDKTLRVRLFALLGGSTALGDHLVAHPEEWKLLAEPLPDSREIFHAMLSAVDAVPEDGDPTATQELDAPGTYRAAEAGNDAKRALKDAYRTLMMRVAAADLAGTFSSFKGVGGDQEELTYREVTELLTVIADAALTAALAVAMRSVHDDEKADGKLAVIAMGKCGARELNYISDVDVIFVAEPADAKATKVASEFTAIGNSAFFDVDPNLRPEGKSGALVRTLDSHEAYYKRWADTWEFQALLKARPMTGDMELGQEYQERLRPMVWESSQRDSFVEDVQAMRRRVLSNVPEDMRTRELKLGSGGLRDVEFAVQLLQLVHGRIDDTLRTQNTIESIEALSAGGYIGREDSARLIEAYEFLRLLEHRLQLHRFRRTHTLPAEDDAKNRRWLALTAGFVSSPKTPAVEAMEKHLKGERKNISDLHSRLFYRPLLNAIAGMSIGEASLTKDAAVAQLKALGYTHPSRAYEHLTALAKGTSRKAKLQAILLPTLMTYLGDTADPDAGLLNYRKLSEAANDRSWFLRMLRDEGVVGERLMHILGTSPYAANLIISAPDVVKQLGDGASKPKLLDTNPDRVYKSLIAATKRHADPDKAVNVARSLRRAELARIASADLLGMMSVREVCVQLSWVWNAVLEAGLRAEIRADLIERELEEPLAHIAVIGMGRLGGEELGYGSDADVMVVAEPSEGVAETDALAWAKKIIDQMRKRLAKPSSDPPLEVDLGLRPEGRSGPVARTIASYERYYDEWGAVWEKQALLRATVCAGDVEVGKNFLTAIDKFRYPEGGANDAEIKEIRRIKARVDNERLPRGADRATHTKLGRGALSDIEWTVQLLTMMHADAYEELHNTSTLEVLDFLVTDEANGIIENSQARKLTDAWLMATAARNALVLVTGKRIDQLPGPGAQLNQVAGAAGYDPQDAQAFLDRYLKVTRRAHRVVEEVFWGEEPSFEFE
ncbi:bifunctional [glutamine synthetase] adenylyltransferase/[glutamine synthetase]-adenylyl-L-tyrosine phosphorylase [Corynebacterium sp. CCUG 70398]|uniref:bifunctional [glutamine synthetase] adenylyltransferase/[glutamine synthetase]-adenylyl-L-tyrosine phosphorylase n=1 Tax=Corynebacterium sp. CCUG 70398 TaxID=2823891 RepID=UPI002108DD8E|nr:bifunctional [glutamine synthetase] adenylyltransferase/[glutamine synthetase]-adenylyl-L-tyrosine phosphorylase [Corynebacterium sp. CCUG 70398]MCQ4622676.1 bifunctional [glutamine synthetase] adenylyltransferase/[glutamine synthetase]-adenylyl-L-tyrosine phosphorylase [Corynebacterium sp. CCUG 70398]